MFGLDSTEVFYSALSEALPVPAIHAEPLERLIAAFVPGCTVMLLQAEQEVRPDWLTTGRIDTHLRPLLLEPVHLQIWPLMERVWVVCLRVSEEIENPVSAIRVQMLRRSLTESLQAAWRSDTEIILPLPEEREAIAHGEPLPLAGENRPSAFSLLPIAPMRVEGDIEDNIAELNSLLDIIVNKQLTSQYQPIIDLRDGQVLGYEALIRGPKGKVLRRFGQMFHAADKASMVSWFDMACQEQCFARAAELGLKKLLFVNMDADGLAWLDMHERSLAMRAREVGLSPASIVIEITERQQIEDFEQMLEYIGKLRDQGFKIAIDDAGSGYNSLYAIAEFRPDFVKIDRALTRNIDTNGQRRALLAALVQYARHIGTSVLAEGSETREELGTLIDLGVPYGQGYLMGRPADDFRGVPREIREFIQQRARQRSLVVAGRSVTIGGMMRKGLSLPLDTPLSFAAQKFARDLSLTSVVVVEDGYVRGLLMRQQLEHVLDMAKAAHVGDLLPDETIEQWMTTTFLSMEPDTPLCEAAKQATTRHDISLETDIVLLGYDQQYQGVVPARVLLEAATTSQENRQRHADPLTGLPGRVALEQALRERLAAQTPLCVIRPDITHFEPFNRHYGVAHGDEVILSLQRLLQDASTKCGGPNDFLAHLGGDDFVLVTEAKAAESLCRALTTGFAEFIPEFYRPEHVRQGYMEITEKNGQVRRAPLFLLAVAALTNRKQRLSHYAQVMDGLRDLLRHAQRQHTSHYVIDHVS